MKIKYLTILIFLLLLYSCSNNKKIKPLAKDGIIDLTNWNLETDGNLVLNGKWEIYWKQFIEPNEFNDTTKILKPDKYVTVPKIWNEDTINNTILAQDGYATYHLKIILNKNEEKKLAFKITTFATAAKIYIDNQLIYQSGDLGKVKQDSKPEYNPQVADFFVDKDTLELVLQISNFYHRKGGIWQPITIGTEEKIRTVTENDLMVDIFLLGCIIIMAVYHIGLFWLRRHDIYTLYFALFCFFIALRIGATGEYLLHNLSWISWNLLVTFEYLSFYVGFIFFGLFLQNIFPKHFKKSFLYFAIITTLIFIIITLVTKPLFFTHFVPYFQIELVFYCLYFIYVLIISIKHKEDGAIAFLLGFIVFFATMINDMLHASEVIFTGNYFSIGVFVFIFAQAFLISLRFSKAFKKTELLTEELNYINQNLENLVKLRTTEIEQQNEEILTQKEELQTINDELFDMNEKLETKNVKIQTQNEHINASIRYAKNIQNAILPSHERISNFFENQLIYRPKDIVSGDFYWLANLEEKQEFNLTEKIFFAAVDCTGHGVPGAFMSLIANRMLSEIVLEQKITSPAEILETLDTHIKTTLDQKNSDNRDGMDICLCMLQIDFDGNKTITYAGAKRPLFYYNNLENKFLTIESTRRSIGGVYSKTEKPFVNNTFKIFKNDILILSTDGFADQNNVERKKFTNAKMLQILEQNIRKELIEQKNILEKYLDIWMQDTEQRDDISLILLKI